MKLKNQHFCRPSSSQILQSYLIKCVCQIWPLDGAANATKVLIFLASPPSTSLETYSLLYLYLYSSVTVTHSVSFSLLSGTWESFDFKLWTSFWYFWIWNPWMEGQIVFYFFLSFLSLWKKGGSSFAKENASGKCGSHWKIKSTIDWSSPEGKEAGNMNAVAKERSHEQFFWKRRAIWTYLTIILYIKWKGSIVLSVSGKALQIVSTLGYN